MTNTQPQLNDCYHTGEHAAHYFQVCRITNGNVYAYTYLKQSDLRLTDQVFLTPVDLQDLLPYRENQQ